VLAVGLVLAALAAALQRRMRARAGGAAGVWARLGAGRQAASPARRSPRLIGS